MEYAVAGSYSEFMRWRQDDLEARRNVVLLTAERVPHFTEPGMLHRIGAWEQSSAMPEALRLDLRESR